jgi:hypothetical protein
LRDKMYIIYERLNEDSEETMIRIVSQAYHHSSKMILSYMIIDALST